MRRSSEHDTEKTKGAYDVIQNENAWERRYIKNIVTGLTLSQLTLGLPGRVVISVGLALRMGGQHMMMRQTRVKLTSNPMTRMILHTGHTLKHFVWHDTALDLQCTP